MEPSKPHYQCSRIDCSLMSRQPQLPLPSAPTIMSYSRVIIPNLLKNPMRSDIQVWCPSHPDTCSALKEAMPTYGTILHTTIFVFCMRHTRYMREVS